MQQIKQTIDQEMKQCALLLHQQIQQTRDKFANGGSEGS